MRKIKKNKKKCIILLVGPNNDYKNKLQHLSQKYKLNSNMFWSLDAIKGNLKYGAILASAGMVLFFTRRKFWRFCSGVPKPWKTRFITKKINIYREILNYKAGFVCRDKVWDVSNTLKKFINLDKSNLKKMSIKANKCFNDNFNLNSNNNNKLADLLNN